MKKSRLLGAVCVVLFSLITMSANAALIGYFTVQKGGGVSDTANNGIHTLLHICEDKFQAVYGCEGAPYSPLLFDKYLFTSDAGTSILINSSTSSEFNGFVDMLTNGIDDWISLNIGFDSNPVGGGASTPESFKIIDSEGNVLGSDLFGYEIEYIQAIFTTVQINTPGLDPNGDGNWTDYSVVVDINVYGSVVPLPPALWLFGSGLLGLVGIARRKKKA